MLNFKKTNEPVPRKLMDEQKDGQMDRPYFIAPSGQGRGSDKQT